MSVSSMIIDGNDLFINFGNATTYMQTRSFKIITDTEGVRYAQIENYELISWFDIEATDSSEMGKYENDLIEVETLETIAKSRGLYFSVRNV